MKKYILAIDQGTTSSRAILFDYSGNPCFSASREVKCLFPQSGWVEVDALSIWVSVIDVVNEVLVKANVSFSDIDSLGITNQRETTVVWDKNSGLPVYNAIVWQSRQTTDICSKFNQYKEDIHQKTGLFINPYFSFSKICFILDHIENGYDRAKNGELLFGTIDTWLMYKMSKGSIFASDVSNASRTMLLNINTLDWDQSLLDLFNIPRCMLPDVFPSSYYYGKATFFSDELKIHGVAGDQQASLFGQTCFDIGESKTTYGTGCFMLLNIGDKPTLSNHGLLTTIAWKIKDKVTYALEGSVFMGGALIHWLRQDMELLSSSKESEDYAYKAKDTNGIYVVPAFVGLGTPYWDDEARGSVFGLTRSSNKYQFVRACLEAIAYQCKDVFEVMKNETKTSIKCLRVDGGVTKNNYLMQFQSDILKTNIILPKCLETTALGVSYLAGLSSGFYKDLSEIRKIHSIQKEFIPSMGIEEIEVRYNGWKKAVKATIEFK